MPQGPKVVVFPALEHIYLFGRPFNCPHMARLVHDLLP